MSRSPSALALLARAILLDPQHRRGAMFYCIIAASVMVVLGGLWLFDWLRSSVWLFAGYWLLCAWLTLLAVLLALFDLLILRRQARRVRRELRERILAGEEKDEG